MEETRGGRRPNRLVGEKSPYLLQHAYNPVDWRPWGPEAFEAARLEDRPIFLSIGYSSCHWCHVMERESFESEETAKVLNAGFVSIKLDREERPDLDEIFMNAVLIQNQGRGGWPMSVFLTPDGKPFFGGTYFSPGPFRDLLRQISGVYRTRRAGVTEQARLFEEALRRMAAAPPPAPGAAVDRSLVEDALGILPETFDERRGGFGARAPKFPPHGVLALILYEHSRRPNPDLLEMAVRTLEAMMLGGIHDHVGGGFHRYSTDERWFLPHFEKMLYDNAQLGRAYTDGFLSTGREDFRLAARGIFDWVLREMTGKEGGFFSALDADSEGQEGKFYVWTKEEILEILGPDHGGFFCSVYNADPEGNFAEEASGERIPANILHLSETIDAWSERLRHKPEALRARLAQTRARLLEVRSRRVWPGLDDKVLTSWNGLMIGSLAHAGARLSEPRYIEAARRAARFLLTTLRKDGRLLAVYRDGVARLNAYLDDHAFLADGLVDLFEATGEREWLDAALDLASALRKRFRDGAAGGFFFTSDDHEALLVRSKDPTDRAIPSGNGVAARAFVRLAGITGDPAFGETAAACLRAFLEPMKRSPLGTESLILSAAMALDREEMGDGRRAMGDARAAAKGAGGTEAKGAAPVAPTPPSASGKSKIQNPKSKIPAPPLAPNNPQSEIRNQKSEITDSPDASAESAPVRAELFLSRRQISPGESLEATLRVTVAPLWHVNSAAPLQDYQVATSLALDPSDTLETAGVNYPDGKVLETPGTGEKISVFEGTFTLPFLVRLKPAARPGPTVLSIKLRFQACGETTCRLPQTLALSVPLQIAENPAAPP